MELFQTLFTGGCVLTISCGSIPPKRDRQIDKNETPQYPSTFRLSTTPPKDDRQVVDKSELHTFTYRDSGIAYGASFVFGFTDIIRNYG